MFCGAVDQRNRAVGIEEGQGVIGILEELPIARFVLERWCGRLWRAGLSDGVRSVVVWAAVPSLDSSPVRVCHANGHWVVRRRLRVLMLGYQPDTRT